MRYLLSLLLIFSIGFAQKTTVIKKQVGDEKKIEVKVNIVDDKILYTITEDGKTEEYEADLNDEDALAKIHEKLEDYDIDEEVKLKVCKRVRAHDCKKESSDPKICDRTRKKECKKDAMIWHMQDEDGDKKFKIIKKHKMMNEPFLCDKKDGFLGIQIQDLSDQLIDYFKVKDGNGVLVSEVVEDSPANNAGLKAGDVVTKVNDKDIQNAADLTKTIRGYDPDSKVIVTVLRNGKKKQLKATLGETEYDHSYNFGDLEELKHFGAKQKMLFKMHEDDDNFEFHGFPFDQKEFKDQMDELHKQMEELKLELKELREEK
jgi:hypothetical protein